MTEETLDLTTDEALLSSLSEHKVGQIELQPFSLMRQVIAMDLCRNQSSAFFNSIMTVWVCTLSPIEALKVHEDIAQAQLSAFAWAEAQGYSLAHYQPLLAAYRRLNDELAASTKARVLGDNDGDAPKNVGGRPLP